MIPDKWWVVTTNIEEDEILTNWCNSIGHNIYPESSGAYYNENGNWHYDHKSHLHQEITGSRTQITIEQFKEFVLKEKSINYSYLIQLLSNLNIK